MGCVVRRRHLRVVFSICCAFGCLTQIVILAADYFSYKTTTKVQIETKATNRAPTVTYCARYIDMIDTKRIKKEKGISILKLGTPNKTVRDIHYMQSHKLTIRDIFDYTPPAGNLLLGCSIRKEGNFRRVESNSRSQCNASFTISKFYMQSFICYNIRPKDSMGSFTINNIAHSYNYEMAIYSITLPELLAKSSVLFLMLSPEKIPHVSRAYGAYTRRALVRDKLYNDVMIQNKVTSVQLLPPPYDSKCTHEYDYSAHSKCLVQKMSDKGVNRVPNTEIILEKFDLRHVLWADEENKTMRELIDQCYDQCEIITRQENCSYSFAETYVTFVQNVDVKNMLRLRVMGAQAPNARTTYHPRIKLTEFFLYTMSSAGIWMGISVVHLNPLLLLYWLKKKAGKHWAKSKYVIKWRIPRSGKISSETTTTHFLK